MERTRGRYHRIFQLRFHRRYLEDLLRAPITDEVRSEHASQDQDCGYTRKSDSDFRRPSTGQPWQRSTGENGKFGKRGCQPSSSAITSHAANARYAWHRSWDAANTRNVKLTSWLLAPISCEYAGRNAAVYDAAARCWTTRCTAIPISSRHDATRYDATWHGPASIFQKHDGPASRLCRDAATTTAFYDESRVGAKQRRRWQ